MFDVLVRDGTICDGGRGTMRSSTTLASPAIGSQRSAALPLRLPD